MASDIAINDRAVERHDADLDDELDEPYDHTTEDDYEPWGEHL